MYLSIKERVLVVSAFYSGHWFMYREIPSKAPSPVRPSPGPPCPYPPAGTGAQTPSHDLYSPQANLFALPQCTITHLTCAREEEEDEEGRKYRWHGGGEGS